VAISFNPTSLSVSNGQHSDFTIKVDCVDELSGCSMIALSWWVSGPPMVVRNTASPLLPGRYNLTYTTRDFFFRPNEMNGDKALGSFLVYDGAGNSAIYSNTLNEWRNKFNLRTTTVNVNQNNGDGPKFSAYLHTPVSVSSLIPQRVCFNATIERNTLLSKVALYFSSSSTAFTMYVKDDFDAGASDMSSPMCSSGECTTELNTANNRRYSRCFVLGNNRFTPGVYDLTGIAFTDVTGTRIHLYGACTRNAGCVGAANNIKASWLLLLLPALLACLRLL